MCFQRKRGLDEASIDVRREHVIDNGRLDMLILVEEQPILLIENKVPSMGRHRANTALLREYQENHYPGHRCQFIFLTREPSKASSPYFQNLTYRATAYHPALGNV